jgi:hypothetical protein
MAGPMNSIPARGPSVTCYSCGGWPACGYRDLNQKHLGRICESCVAAAKSKKDTKADMTQ